MDYIELPRELIYKERNDLKDFGVQIPGTINNYLFTQMRKLTLLRCGNAKEIALQCLNNAYYICTLIQLDEFPDLCMDKYEKKLLEVPIPFPDDVYQASMALVCVLLSAYDDKYKQKDNLLIESIHHWTSSNKWTGSESRKSFEDIIKSCNTDRFVLLPTEFAPRNIIEVIETFSEKVLQFHADYICERLAHLKDPSQRRYGADMAIAKIKDYQRELCKDSEYNPKKDSFKYAENDPYSINFDYEDKIRKYYQQSKEAIDYYIEHYPNEDDIHPEQQTDSELSISNNAALVTGNEHLKQVLTQRLSEINELRKENDELKKKLAKMLEPIEELTAEQKVRMAFALNLLKASGLTDEMLDENKSKVAKLIHLLTNIGAKNNGNYPPTQICQNWLVDKQYYPERNIEIIKDINTLCAQLQLNTKSFLVLGAQSNDKM